MSSQSSTSSTSGPRVCLNCGEDHGPDQRPIKIGAFTVWPCPKVPAGEIRTIDGSTRPK